jgi:ribonuclease P protein component
MQRTSRLASASDIRRTYSEGRRASSQVVVAHVRRTGEPRPARVAVSAVRGIGTAVERNRAKRRVREAVRRLDGRVDEGVDAVLVATARATRAAFQDLVNSVRDTLARAGALSG